MAEPIRGGFVAMPRELLNDERTNPYTVAVYAALASRCIKSDVVWAALPTLASEAHASRSAVQRELKRLLEMGWITPADRAGYRNRTVSYKIRQVELMGSDRPDSTVNEVSQTLESGLTDPLNEVSQTYEVEVLEVEELKYQVPKTLARQAQTTSHEPDTLFGASDPAPNGKSKNAATSEPDGWAEFWAAYPMKRDKPKAKGAYITALKRATAAVLIKAAQEYRDDPNRDDTHTKYPQGWLSGERWNDGPLPTRRRDTQSTMTRNVPPAGHAHWNTGKSF